MLKCKGAESVIATEVEVMRSAKSRSLGMLKFNEAPENYAAVFELPLGGFFPAIHTFGMKFSIDILFCDAEKKIRALYLGVSPGRLVLPLAYFFGGIRYVVEIPRTQAALRVNDCLDWEAA